jgi:hypothetical protein
MTHLAYCCPLLNKGCSVQVQTKLLKSVPGLRQNTMKYGILILVPTFLLLGAPEVEAHDLVTASGQPQDHQHVYRRQEYGKPLQQGHLFPSHGTAGVILWGPGTRSDYGKSTTRRSGPIIDDRNPGPGAIHNRGSKYRSSKYGSAVRGYGAVAPGYGKTRRGK